MSQFAIFADAVAARPQGQLNALAEAFMPSSAPPPQPQLLRVDTPSFSSQPLRTAYYQILLRHGKQRADDMFSHAEQERWVNRRGIFSGPDDISDARTTLDGLRLREETERSVKAEKAEYLRWREKHLRELCAANAPNLHAPRRGPRSRQLGRTPGIDERRTENQRSREKSSSTDPQRTPPSLTHTGNSSSSLRTQTPPTPVLGRPPDPVLESIPTLRLPSPRLPSPPQWPRQSTPPDLPRPHKRRPPQSWSFRPGLPPTPTRCRPRPAPRSRPRPRPPAPPLRADMQPTFTGGCVDKPYACLGRLCTECDPQLAERRPEAEFRFRAPGRTRSCAELVEMREFGLVIGREVVVWED